MTEPLDITRALFDTKFLGVTMVQQWVDLVIWERVFANYKFKHVVELGSGWGALSFYLLLQSIQHEAQFTSCEFDVPYMADTKVGKLLNLRGHILVGDIGVPSVLKPEAPNLFPHAGNAQKIIEIITAEENKPILFWCDNGNKPVEFASFLPYLSVGDVIAVHDWGNEFGPADIPATMAHRLKMLFPDECENIKALTRWWEVVA